jgi:hypothetical protein
MPPLFRRPAVPAGLTLGPGERLLARAESEAGPLAATTRHLVLPADGGFHAIGWEKVERATWSRDDDQLVVVETAPLGAEPRRHRVGLGEATRFLDVVREQVQASVVISRHVPITDERGVRVSGRRRPGRRALAWVVAVDAGIDLDDPTVRAKVDQAVAQVRAEVE